MCEVRGVPDCGQCLRARVKHSPRQESLGPLNPGSLAAVALIQGLLLTSGASSAPLPASFCPPHPDNSVQALWVLLRVLVLGPSS